MSLPPRPTTPGDWSAEIGLAAEAFMNARVSVFDPAQLVTTPYDPATDTGGYGAPLLLFTSKARVQHLKSPSDAIAGGARITKRAIRVQVPLGAYTPLLTAGLLLRVTDGGKDPALVGVAYTVLSAINSSHAALRTIECVTELTPAPAVA